MAIQREEHCDTNGRPTRIRVKGFVRIPLASGPRKGENKYCNSNWSCIRAVCFFSQVVQRMTKRKHLRWAKSTREFSQNRKREFSQRFKSLAFVGDNSSPTQNTEFGPRRPCVRCTAIRIARLAFLLRNSALEAVFRPFPRFSLTKTQRAPKDPPKSELRVSFCSFSSLLPIKQQFCRQRSLPKHVLFVPRGPAEWPARVDRVR